MYLVITERDEERRLPPPAAMCIRIGIVFTILEDLDGNRFLLRIHYGFRGFTKSKFYLKSVNKYNL